MRGSCSWSATMSRRARKFLDGKQGLSSSGAGSDRKAVLFRRPMSTTFNADTGGIGGHPRGLTTLFLTEFWERFSYYGMRAILTLFMVGKAADGGLGLDVATAAAIYGFYTAAVFFMGIPRGWIPHWLLGHRNPVLHRESLIARWHYH